MRKTAVILLLLVIVVIGVGFYLGWFGVSASHDSDAGRTAIQFVIDQNKIKADFNTAKERISGAASGVNEQTQGQ